MQQLPPTASRRAIIALFAIFFVSGFTALLYQVVWQRMLGLFSGSDVRSVTIVVASYLLGLGLGSLLGGALSDRFSSRRAIQMYGICNLGVAAFALFSRFLFYDLLFRQFNFVAQSMALTLLIVFMSLLIPTVFMGVSLPFLAKAISRSADQAAPRIGWLYGINTLGSGVGTFVGGWYIVGTLGYERTVYLGAALSTLVGGMALTIARRFQANDSVPITASRSPQTIHRLVIEWCVLVFIAGFVAISLEIIWFRILNILLQSIAYTYAHLLGFLLVSNALGSLVGATLVSRISNPRRIFLWIQGGVVIYALLSIGIIGLYWQMHPPDLRSDLGYIHLHHLDTTILVRYLVIPVVMLVLPNFLLGFYVPLVQKVVQTDPQQIGQRVGLIQLANIIGNTVGSLCTGLVLLDTIGTADSLRLLAMIGLGFVLLNGWRRGGALITLGLLITLATTIAVFPSNVRLWAALHGIQPQAYFIAAEDAAGIAAITETQQQGTLLASGQAQASFPYLHVHALLGTLPALMHPHPEQIMVIGLGSGGTAHTVGANPMTRQVQVVELLGAEFIVLRDYAQTAIGRPLRFLFQDPRYEFIEGDGRRELTLSDHPFDIIEADAIYPWRSRAGMLYSQEFFQEVQSHLKPGGIFVEWNAGRGIKPTFRHVFPHVVQLSLSGDLHVLIGSNQPLDFDRQAILHRLNDPAVLQFLANAEVNVEAIRDDVRQAKVEIYAHAQDGQPPPFNTDLFPRSEYYLNQFL